MGLIEDIIGGVSNITPPKLLILYIIVEVNDLNTGFASKSAI